MRRFILAIAALAGCASSATAQTPGVLYTWSGTGNVHEWVGGSAGNAATVSNSTAGQLTVVEMGDPLEPFDPGGTHVIRDGFNRRLESSIEQGGLDVWGLEALEIDLMHNGSGNIDVQFFLQLQPDFLYVWAGSDGTLNGPDFTLGPGMHTLRFPLNILTPAQQSYIRTVGLDIRNHLSVGNVTWNIFEVRSTGTAPEMRDLATHDVGTSDNGLNGAYINFDRGTALMPTVIGGNGNQNQVGLSHNASGSGSLQWTDRGDGGDELIPSGAAISWVNGTVFEGNSFNERLADFSNYDTVTFRMSATDPLGGGGDLGIQAFFQTGNYDFQTTTGGAVGEFGEINLPIDGQYHDLVFPLAAVTNRQNVQAFGVNLFSHMNNLTINVDLVQFAEVDQIPGDHNLDGKVDAADYALWRSNPAAYGGDPQGYLDWRNNFGAMAGSGGGGLAAVPEPSGAVMLIGVVAAALAGQRRRCKVVA
jgi:hypothetical protein